MTFSRNAPECPGPCSASPASAPPPTGGPCGSCVPSCPASPRQCAGCAACSPPARLPRGRWDYRTLCPDTDFAEILASVAAARPRSPRSSFPTAWCRERWRRRLQPPVVRRQPRQSRYASCLVCRDPWGLGRRDPPKTRLAHRGIGALPFPVDPAQFVAVLDQNGPDALEHALGDPSLQGAMHAAVVAKFLGQLIPLAAGAHHIDDAVERLALSGPRPASLGRRVQFVQDRFNDFPQFVVDLPDRGQQLGRLLPLGHPWLLC